MNNDYQKTIEERLDPFVPKFKSFELLLEKNTYVNNAPKVKGYFKFISIRYIRTVKAIKKLCVEYINTYIDGALNLAKNMNETKLIEGQNSLANDLDFSVVGASTHGKNVRSDNKKGVLFLIGDKALKNKIDAILQKIKMRAKKSESLSYWAELMILQSKIIANDIIYEKTTKMLTGKNKEEARKNQKKYKESIDKNQKEAEKKAAEVSQSIESQIKNNEDTSNLNNVDKKTVIEDMLNNDELPKFEGEIKDLTKETEDQESHNDESKDQESHNDESEYQESHDDSKNKEIIQELLKEFYDIETEKIKSGFYKEQDTVITANDVLKNVKEFYDNVDNIDLASTAPYILSCAMVAKMKNDKTKKFVASPSDIARALVNTKSAMSLYNKTGHTELIDNSIKLDTYDCKLLNIEESVIEKAWNALVKIDKQEFDESVVYYFTRMLSKDKSIYNTNESIKIMKIGQFIVEEMIQNTITYNDASDAMFDMLLDCEDGCIYIGNLPGITQSVDYIMLYDNDTKWGFFKECGNKERALENGKPLRPRQVKFAKQESLDILNAVFDTLSEYMMHSDIE